LCSRKIGKLQFIRNAEQIAAQIKNKILDRVKAPGNQVVDVAAEVAEFSAPPEKFATAVHEVDELIRIATEKSGV
jgi:ubiquinone biosynthesis protein COQ9